MQVNKQTLTVAIVGAGVIGCSWAAVWVRAGHRVAIFDSDISVLEGIRDRLLRNLRDSVGDPQASLAALEAGVVIHSTLEDAVAAADLVHESVAEKVEVKRELFERLDRVSKPEAILASSTSAIPLSQFTEGLLNRHRCVIVHPATPPHTLPATEVVPAPWTDAAVVERTLSLLEEVGQSPVLVKKDHPGFAMNRLQGALLIEMFRLIEAGVVTAADADKLVTDGFALRWAVVGPLQAIDLNADGGLEEYLARYGDIYDRMAMERHETERFVSPSLARELVKQFRDQLPLEQLEAKRSWRDQRIAKLKRLLAKKDSDR
ncbi:3-hydroxyacyl-CoA dehydrogenase [Paraburkholderia sabiae]|uniref:L-gulonate 3-dehydrogenase n=1 Tax=Paraburkholderia sabiae TaxID=273251 RepID=A0ABU9QLG6_9BURK|nr:3-hydroxyacyl-CoA dehydrogenase [Paraburkholderia sabiae]WJZ79272.1 3-hydroxyacyl-CoA dehydrogenase [Paraburkholderia sabiae]CAD6560778.1 L-carnitine dehydrogenase [Paraburkholderia sabiae]